MMLYHPGDAILDILIDIIVRNLGYGDDQSVHHWGRNAIQHCSFLGYVHTNLIEVTFPLRGIGYRVSAECPRSFPVTS